MRQSDMPKPIAAERVEMFGAIHTGKLIKDYWKHRPQLGKVKLEDFAKIFAIAYTGRSFTRAELKTLPSVCAPHAEFCTLCLSFKLKPINLLFFHFDNH
jgi:hypothetical protein